MPNRTSRIVLLLLCLGCVAALHAQDAAPRERLFVRQRTPVPKNNVPAPTVAPRATGLTIVPTWDSSINNDPNAANIKATINSAIAVYESTYSNPITVTITFQEGGGLGASNTFYGTYTYASYRAALASNASGADDTLALQHLPNQAANPVNSNVNVDLNTALARAVGFSDSQSAPPQGQTDSTITLNIALMNITAADTNQQKYSLFAVVSHEIDEVLGFGSNLDSVANGSIKLTDDIDPEDLFRYDSSGKRSYTTSTSASSFFSIDGTTDLAQFNQDPSGDYGDWYSVNGGQTPQVQDAFGTPGSTPVLGVELRVLDVIGYVRGSGGGGSSGPVNLTLNTSPGITIPASARTGGPVTLSASVINNGTGSSGGFNVRFFLSPISTYSAATATVIGDAPVASINGSVTATATFTGNCPSVAVGKYYVIAYIDFTNQVTETNETDNVSASTTQLSVTLNHAPVISSAASYTPNPAFVDLATTFTAAATDADNDTLTYTWDFGDGSGTGTGASTMYTYMATGTYTATVTVSDGFGGMVTSSVLVTVDFPAYQGTNTKQSFSLNFKTLKDSISITMSNANFAHGADGTEIDFVIGDIFKNTATNVDTGTLLRNKAKGLHGNFTLTTRKGTILYSTTKAKLQALLAPFGATNTTTVTTVKVPIYFFFNNGFYGNTFSFAYTAKAGKTGKGK